MALAKVKISDLPTTEEISISGQENMEISTPAPTGSKYPYVSRKLSFSRFGNWLGNIFNFNQLETDAKTLVGAINEVNDSGGGGDFWSTIPNNAGAHNSIYRGKNLGSPANINWDTIERGEFEDMFIGDYWEVYDEPTDQTIIWRIAAFDYYINIGMPINTAHHITVIPDETIVDAPTVIFSSKGGGALGGYIHSDIKGYKTIEETHTPNELYFNNDNWYIDLSHWGGELNWVMSDNTFDTNWIFIPDRNHGSAKLRTKNDSSSSTPPQFTTLTVSYKYLDDSDLTTITETFTNADVKTSGSGSSYTDSNGYIILNHKPVFGITQFLVDGVEKYPDTSLNGYLVTTSNLKNINEISITYSYNLNYGGINEASRIIERAFGLNEHIMQTNKSLTGYGIFGYFEYDYIVSDVDLPTEQQIMGNRTIGVEDNWNGHGYHSKYNREMNMESTQLPLFALNPSLRGIRNGYWLRDRCYATPLSDPPTSEELHAFDTHYLCVNGTGEVTAGSGSGLEDNPIGIRPIFNLARTQIPYSS